MSADEPEALRAEIARLQSQVKLLVRAEQGLHRARREQEQQAAMVRDLASFSRACASDDAVATIVDRALRMLDARITLDVLCAATLDDAAVIDLDAPDASDSLHDDERAWLAELREVRVTPIDDESLGALPRGRLREAVEGVRRPACFAVIPLRVEGRTMAALWLAASSSGRRTFRDDRLELWHAPFLALCQGSVERALENAALTRALGDANTQLRATVQGLQRAQEELLHARKMEAVGHLAGGVAHEFNNLLTVVLSYGAMLQELSLPEPARVDLARMLDAGTRASELTRQLLTLGRRQVLRREPVDLGAVVSAFVGLMGRLVGETVSLSARVTPSLPSVLADRAQVEQVLMNLTLNARDALPRGGSVVIGARPASARDLASVSCDAAPEGYLALDVIDSGVGMDAATRARIFEPFFTLKGEGKGTGLGLSVVYGIVAQSEGHIAVESEPGRGARFTVLLPVAPSQSERPRVSAPAPAPRGRQGRVLLAEDEPLIRHVTVRALRAAGYEVCDAQDGEEALLRASTLDGLDALITDVVMPQMGGVELSERLRAQRPGLPVLFISGYSPTLLEGLRVERRGIAYLPKPFTPKQLLSQIDALLGHGG